MLTGPGFKETPLKGVWLVEPKRFEDHRGFFMEVFNRRDFQRAGLDVSFVQDNMSRSAQGTLRGLHYQVNPHAMGKLVRVVRGSVFDVAVDIRRGSPAFGRWVGYTLSEENKLGLYVPPGFAHGFLTLSEVADVTYKCTSLYEPAADRSVLWSDPAIGVKWPIPPDEKQLSDKDRVAPPLRDAENNFTFA